MHAASLFDVARPFLWLAAISFAIGFVGYLLIGGGAQALDLATPTVEPIACAQDLPRAA